MILKNHLALVCSLSISVSDELLENGKSLVGQQIDLTC